MTTWSKTIRDGRTITVTPTTGLSSTIHLVATLDGQTLAEGRVSEQPAALRPTPDHTHRLGKLALTTAEAAQLDALLRDAQAAAEATPEGARRKLRHQRDRLVVNLNAAILGAEDNRAAATDSDGIARYYTSGQHDRDETAIAAARAALDDFDATHPDIRADVDAQRDAMVTRTVNQ